MQFKNVMILMLCLTLKNHILVYNSNKMHKSQSLFYLTTALHVSVVTINHLQEHKTTVTAESGNRYTVPQHTQISSNSSTIAADNSMV
jgi:hypothetical protein